MYTYISIALGALGALLIFSPDSLVSPNTTNKTLAYIRDNNNLFGLTLLAAAGYVYMTYVQKKQDGFGEDNSSLPTYEESEIEYSSKTPSYMKSNTGSYRSRKSVS
jgi:drug/metabolite transporter (DMT)-like permease